MTTEVRPIGGSGTVDRLVRWTLGMAVAGARYIFQRVPLYRRARSIEDSDGSLPDFDRTLPGDAGALQRADDGVGALFHRHYTIFVTDERLDAEALVDHILGDPNGVAPSRMARFETFDGEVAKDLDLGDELIVRLPGPWDGPVRVIERTPTSFRLATLKGHLEAGEIEFSTGYDDRGFLRFRIESWARSGDAMFHWLYEKFPVGREAQMHMWSQFCRRVAAASGGTLMSNVASTTRRVE